MKRKNLLKNQEGFLVADFLFSFILVLSCGAIIFALTFSLMTLEVAQYITWSAARSYSAAALDKDSSATNAQNKFQILASKFPLLTGESGNWFELTFEKAGELQPFDKNDFDKNNRMGQETRQPWTGVRSSLKFKLFSSMKLPFLGPISDKDVFTMPVRAFLIRNPSQDECMTFMQNKFQAGVLQMDDFTAGGYFKQGMNQDAYVPQEDNGC